MGKAFVKTTYAVPERTVPKRPAHATRKYLNSEHDSVPIQAHPESLERLDERLPDILQNVLTIFLHEHCVFNDNEYLWIHIQKKNVNAAIHKATETVLQHTEEIHHIFARCGGNQLTTAYLVGVTFWQEAAREISDSLKIKNLYEKITKKTRPRGGLPLFDESLRKIAELESRGE